jgi:hypothetical protein
VGSRSLAVGPTSDGVLMRCSDRWREHQSVVGGGCQRCDILDGGENRPGGTIEVDSGLSSLGIAAWKQRQGSRLRTA